MANSDKNIVITPNRSLTGQPQIAFTGFSNVPITLKVLDDSNGTLSFEGSAGQLFSINNNLTSGSIFSVNDVSGIPSIDVNANGTVSIAAFGGNVGIGKTSPTTKLDVTGTVTATAFSGPLTGNASTATTLATGRTIGMTGDVTWTSASFDGSANVTGTATIANDVVTYAKIQNVSATSRLLGRATAGAGDIEEITIGSGLTLTGTTLSSSGGGSTPNDGILTLNVSGTGLSGSQTFTANQSTNATFTVTSNATSANTASTIVARDASGNFTAGTITAALTGNASTATTLQTGRTIGMTGDVTWTSASFNGSADVTGTATLANSGVGAGTYRSVTVDAKGRVTAGTNPTTISGYGITDALSNSTTSTQSGYFGDVFLYDDSTPSHYLQITNSANLTAARILSINVNDANRTVSLSGDLTLANNFTTSGNFALTLTTTASTNVTLPTTGTLATTGNLSQFASTTSAQLATLISDETGSGVLVFGTSPAITTSITTPSTSFDVFNTTATTVNAFQAATAISMGATTGTTTVRNDLSVTKSVTATEGFRVGSSAINAQTIAYSLQASDNGKIVTINSASAVNVTVGTAVGAAGFSCTVIQLGAGQVTFVASSTTLNSANGLKISAQHGAATLFCYTTNTFNVAGNLTA